MILTDIREYLRERGQATLVDIALHVESDPDAVRGMLERLRARGQVACDSISAACGGCNSKCNPVGREIWFWTGEN